MDEETYGPLLKCPYCGYEDNDSWELGSNDNFMDEDGETECKKCERKFLWTKSISITYIGKPLEEDN